MLDELLFRAFELVTLIGLPLSILAWFTVAFWTAAMLYALRYERRWRIWVAGFVVGGIALAANFADYAVTFQRSPDLAMEANPLWLPILRAFGLTAAKWYGVTGKLFVSSIAGLMYAYYAAHRSRLFPAEARSLVEFARRMGENNHGWKQRGLALWTVFGFFFAGIQLLFFYVAFLNSTTDPEVFDRIPSFPAAAMLLTLALVAAFLILTYRAFRKASG